MVENVGGKMDGGRMLEKRWKSKMEVEDGRRRMKKRKEIQSCCVLTSESEIHPRGEERVVSEDPKN
jgi:hypothetical protein